MSPFPARVLAAPARACMTRLPSVWSLVTDVLSCPAGESSRRSRAPRGEGRDPLWQGFGDFPNTVRAGGKKNGSFDVSLSPNPPKDTDGRREDSGRGWVRELQGRWPGVGVDGRPADGLQSPHRAPKALCGSCDARDERIRSRGLSRPGWREIAGTPRFPT